MAVRFNPLPLEVFAEPARPSIRKLNTQLRDLFALEGTIRAPLSVRRSDKTIARKQEPILAFTKLAPSPGTKNIYRRDVLENIGDPQIFAEGGQPFFWENRSGANKGNALHVAVEVDGAGTWKWKVIFRWGGV